MRIRIRIRIPIRIPIPIPIRIQINVTHVSLQGNYVPFRSRNVLIRPLRAVKTILEIFPPLNVQLLLPALLMTDPEIPLPLLILMQRPTQHKRQKMQRLEHNKEQ